MPLFEDPWPNLNALTSQIKITRLKEVSLLAKELPGPSRIHTSLLLDQCSVLKSFSRGYVTPPPTFSCIWQNMMSHGLSFCWRGQVTGINESVSGKRNIPQFKEQCHIQRTLPPQVVTEVLFGETLNMGFLFLRDPIGNKSVLFSLQLPSPYVLGHIHSTPFFSTMLIIILVKKRFIYLTETPVAGMGSPLSSCWSGQLRFPNNIGYCHCPGLSPRTWR